MKWYAKTAIALGFVGVVGMAAAAFGQTGSSSPSPAPTATQQAGRHGARLGLGRRVVHGDLKLQTRQGFADAIVDTGRITAIDHKAGTLTIKRADGKTVSLTTNEHTRVRKDRARATFGDLSVGDFAQLIQIDRGNGFVLAVIRAHSASSDATQGNQAL